MGIMNTAKGGADLGKPRMSAGWIIAASVGVVMLMIAVGIGGYLYNTGKRVVGGVKPTSAVTAGADTLSGVFGDGT